MMIDVSTHQRVDLDALLSTFIYVVYLLKKGLKNIKLHFVLAGTTGPGVNLDTGMGEFDHHQKGMESECAASLVWYQLPDSDDKEALQALVEMILCQDLGYGIFPRGTCIVSENGETQPIPDYLRTVGNLQAVLSGFHSLGLNDQQIIEQFWTIFSGLAVLQKNRIQAEREYSLKAIQLTKHVVFIDFEDDSSLFYQMMGLAFRQDGAWAVVYRFSPAANNQTPNGYGFGIKRRNGLLVDLNQLQSWIEEQGETNWFFHRDGFLACHGDLKNPRAEPSQIDEEELAEQFEILLAESGIRV